MRERHYKGISVKKGKQIYDRVEAGERIRRQREKLGIQRREVADRIGKAEKYYADIERGYCGMSLDTMVDIAVIIPGLFEPPVRALRATVPENESRIFR